MQKQNEDTQRFVE